ATPSSNFFVCMLHTGVSSEGTTLNRRALPGVPARLRISSPAVQQAKSGALSPALSCGPARVSLLPLKVTALARFFIAFLLWQGESDVVYGKRMNAARERQITPLRHACGRITKGDRCRVGLSVGCRCLPIPASAASPRAGESPPAPRRTARREAC